MRGNPNWKDGQFPGQAKGKPKGAVHKKSKLIRRTVEQFLIDEVLPDMSAFYNELRPGEKATFVAKMMAFVLVKQRAVEHSGKITVEESQSLMYQIPDSFIIPNEN